MSENEDRAGGKRILIVDDHPIMRQGLAQLIAQEPGLAVCGEAEDAHGALQAIGRLHPDVAIVDIALKEGNGLELIKDIKIRYPELAVLVLSMYDESIYAERCLRAGARGYVTKAEASSRVIEALREVLRGGVYVTQQMASKMLRKLVGGDPNLDSFPMDRLSDREFQVFELIGQGLQGREIAKKLTLSVKTVDAHRENIKKKLDLASATELLIYAVQWVQLDRRS